MATLLDQQAIAVDTESNSLYAYQEQICLIQFSTLEEDYLVDPLAGLDISPLGQVFVNREIQKVFHAAEYDVMCFKRDFDFQFVNLFDTMWAARILGWPRVGLGDVLKETFDVRTNKRYQRYNWGKRPLVPKALAYARLDTHYLLPLRDLQLDALLQQGRWEEAQEVFEQVAASEPTWQDFDAEDFWGVKGAHDLAPREQAILRELFIWRDREARRQDRPPFKVLNDHILVALAQARPRELRQVAALKGVKTYHVRRYGKRILQAVKRGERAKVPQPPSLAPRPSEEVIARYQALRAWRKGVAEERGVDVDVVVSNAVLWSLAKKNPDSIGGLNGMEGFGPWRRETYGRAILNELKTMD